MPRKCSIIGCRGNYRKRKNTDEDDRTEYVSTFRFPKDEARRKEWLQRIPQENLTAENITNNMCVCERHFDSRYIIRDYTYKRPDGSTFTSPRMAAVLSDEAVPTRFPSTSSHLPTYKRTRRIPGGRHAELGIATVHCDEALPTVCTNVLSHLPTNKLMQLIPDDRHIEYPAKNERLFQRLHSVEDCINNFEEYRLNLTSKAVDLGGVQSVPMTARRETPTVKETIGYDEYMDGGIPDCLLEGLGFYKNPDGETGRDNDESVADSKVGENSDVQGTLSANNGLKEPPSRVRNHRMPKIVLKQPSPTKQSSPAKQPLLVSERPPVLPSGQPSLNQQGYQSGRGNSKVVVKGNIMYERTESGEVIASVIKNGIHNLSTSDGVVSPSGTTVGASPPITLPRGRPPSIGEIRSGGTLSWMSGEFLIPSDCPINENNVEMVLDESINATLTMRRTLTNLKDDLRRMGGGPTVTPALRPIHLQHRVDVARKLACAFVEYRELISKISNDNALASVANLMLGSPDQNRENKSTYPSVLPKVMPAVNRKRAYAAAKISPLQSVDSPLPRTDSSVKRKSVVPKVNATSVKRNDAAPQEVESIVSDDLWMSCEPCD